MQSPSTKSVIIIAGPTAVGKTSLAIRLAKHIKTEIISADSRQCYRELKIGVARPTPSELQEITHHFIATHSIHEEVNAADFEIYAIKKVNELFANHDTVSMVGGTGLYIKAFCEGLDNIPPIDAGVRENIVQGYEEKGLAWLQEQISQKDPAFFKSGEIKNPHRIMRALEVIEGTGQSILAYRKGERVERNFNIIKIGLDLPREELVRNINSRVQMMMQAGLLEEVRPLVPYRDLNALQTVGYAELFDHIEGKLSLNEAIERIKITTRQYAKRQMTWFKRDREMNWFHPAQYDKLLSFVTKELEGI